jgi:hypothetical protein
MTSGRLDQHHTPLPPERRAFDTQLLDKVAYAYRDHCVTAILRDYFNREEQTYRRLAPDQGWPGNDVEAYHKRTNTHLKAWYHAIIAPDALPDHELHEQNHECSL